jgi:hypothetical protein
LVEVARDPERFFGIRKQQSVFDSTGWALEDLVVMDLVLEWSDKLKFGKRVEIESIPVDPWNPYDFLQQKPASDLPDDGRPPRTLSSLGG